MIPTREYVECRRHELLLEAERFRRDRAGSPTTRRRWRAALGAVLIRAGQRLAATEPSRAPTARRHEAPAQT